MKTHDLTESDDPEARAAVLRLYLGLLQGHYQKIDVMRFYFFKVGLVWLRVLCTEYLRHCHLQILDGGGPRKHPESGKTLFVAKHAREDLVISLKILDALTSEDDQFRDNYQS